MSAAPSTAEPTPVPGPQDQGTNRHAPLLGLLRKILDYGRDLVATLQRQNSPFPSTETARRFGTLNLALIIARITRGLRLVTGLEARLLRARPPQAGRRAPRRGLIGPRPARPPRPTQSEEDAALLRALPTAQEIAAHVRARSAGAVIVEICRDLGIDATHPLWRDIRNAIIAYDGSLSRMLKLWMGQATAFLAILPASALSWPMPAPAPHAWGTGPP